MAGQTARTTGYGDLQSPEFATLRDIRVLSGLSQAARGFVNRPRRSRCRPGHPHGQSSLVLDDFLAAKALHHREVAAEFLARFPDICFVFKNFADIIALEVLPSDKGTDRDVE